MTENPNRTADALTTARQERLANTVEAKYGGSSPSSDGQGPLIR